MIKVVNKFREPNHIYCGRGTPLGNMFIMRDETQRDAVCESYERWFKGLVKKKKFLKLIKLMPDDPTYRKLEPAVKMLIMLFWEAQSNEHINLGCYCAPKRCHCDTIKKFLDKVRKRYHNAR